MRVPIVVPILGSGEQPLRLSAWFVDLGDTLLAGDLVAEVLFPGVTFDVVSESAGQLVEIVKLVDSTIHEGEILGWIDDESR